MKITFSDEPIYCRVAYFTRYPTGWMEISANTYEFLMYNVTDVTLAMMEY